MGELRQSCWCSRVVIIEVEIKRLRDILEVELEVYLEVELIGFGDGLEVGDKREQIVI